MSQLRCFRNIHVIVSIGVFIIGVLLALTVSTKWPKLRGGVELAPPQSATPSVSKKLQGLRLTRARQSKTDFKQAFRAALSWDTRHRLVTEQTQQLLPQAWEQALDVALLMGPRNVPAALLAQIFDTGDTAAVLKAYDSGIPVRLLGEAVRGSADGQRLLLETLKDGVREGSQAALFLAQAWAGDSVVLDGALRSLEARFGAQYIGELAEQFLDAVHLSGDVSRMDALDLLAKASPNAYIRSKVENVARRLGAAYPTAEQKHENIAGVSELNAYLEIATHARLHQGGAEAAAQWAIETLAPEQRERQLRTIFEAAASQDALAPVLLAVQLQDDNLTPEAGDRLIDTAIEVARRSSSTVSAEAYVQLQRLLPTRPQLQGLLDVKAPAP